MYMIYDDLLDDLGNVPIPIDSAQNMKYLGYAFGSTSSSAMQMGQNITEAGFRGNVINAVSCTVRGELILPPGALGTTIIRMIWFWDTAFASQASGVQFPAGPQSILATFTGGTTVPTPGQIFSGYNPTTVGKGKRFQILKENTYRMCANASNTTIPLRYKLRLKKKMGVLTASASNSTFAQGLGVLLISDDDVGETPYAQCYLNLRLCYTTG